MRNKGSNDDFDRWVDLIFSIIYRYRYIKSKFIFKIFKLKV